MKHPLWQKAQATINANLVETEAGQLLSAGGNQFRSLWVRDFCLSVPGLLALGFADLVERQLKVIFRHRGESGFLPRGLDVVNPKSRVVRALLRLPAPDYPGKKLQPEFLGEHGTPAFDSNLLFILAALALEKKIGRATFSTGELLALLNPLGGAGGLLSQPAFSDWQDSVRREGKLLHTQLLHLSCLLGLGQTDSAGRVRAAITAHFYFEGHLREERGISQISLDSYARLICEPELFPENNPRETYAWLRKNPLWTGQPIPGRPVYPAHPARQVSWTTKAVGLRHYHDEFIWGWLSAEAHRSARHVGDLAEADRILNAFTKANEPYPWLAEIYTPALAPVKTWVYQSEAPFTWTAAKWAEALA
jgi:hypothetical protein